jgi:hypothetical protein
MKAQMTKNTRRLLLVCAVAGTLSACSGGPDPSSIAPAEAVSPPGTVSDEASATNDPVVSQLTTTPVAGLPECTKYKYNATVGTQGKSQVINGEACRQPDGSWAIAEQPVGSQYVYQEVYMPPPDVTDWDGPCFYGAYGSACPLYAPFGFSIGFLFFTDGHNHIHRFVSFGSFNHFPFDHGHFFPFEHGHFFRHEGFDRGGFHGSEIRPFAGGAHR